MHDAAGVGSVHIDKRKHLPVGRGCKVKTPNSRSSNHLSVEMRAEKPTTPAEINDRKLCFSPGPLPAAISSKLRFYILLTPLTPLPFNAEVCVCAYHMNSGMQWPLEAQTSQHCMDWGGEGGARRLRPNMMIVETVGPKMYFSVIYFRGC